VWFFRHQPRGECAGFVVVPILGRLAAGSLRMDAGESRALVFTSVTRNSLVVFPLALSLPEGYRLAPAIVVTQTLVELMGMVILTRVVPAWLVPDSSERIVPAEMVSRD
jgi:arsenite transporter